MLPRSLRTASVAMSPGCAARSRLSSRTCRLGVQPASQPAPADDAYGTLAAYDWPDTASSSSCTEPAGLGHLSDRSSDEGFLVDQRAALLDSSEPGGSPQQHDSRHGTALYIIMVPASYAQLCMLIS